VSPSTFIDRNQKFLLTRLQQLVQTETPNPPGENYDQITRYLVRELEALGLKTRRYSIPKAVLRESLPPAHQVFPRFNVLGKLAVPGAKKSPPMRRPIRCSAPAGWCRTRPSGPTMRS